MSVHRPARGFDTAAGVYDRVRPGYPPEAIAWFGLVERAESTSFIAALPEETPSAALTKLRRFEDRAPKPIVLPHVCELFAFERYTRP